MILLMYISFTGDDYNVTQQSLQIPAGSTSASIIVDIINDMIHEDDETFDITITLMTTCLAISVDDNVTTVTIFDDEGKSSKIHISLAGFNATINVTC